MSTLTTNPMVLTAPGIISTTPIVVKKIVLYPNSAGDACTFYYWNPGSVKGKVDAATTTVATGVITSTAAFTTTLCTALGVIHILGDSKIAAGTQSANAYLWRFIASRDSDNQITTAPTTLSDEAAATYYWETFAPITGPRLLSPGTEKVVTELDVMHDPIEFPNLLIATLSTSAVVHLYV